MFSTFTMKVSPAIIVIVMAGFCQANPVDDLSDTGYRCPVKDKFLNRGNSFDYVRDIDSWQACGKNISEEYWTYLNFVSFQDKSASELLAMVMAMGFALFGAYTGRYATSTHLVQKRIRKMSLMPSVEREDVATSKTSKLNFSEMTE